MPPITVDQAERLRGREKPSTPVSAALAPTSELFRPTAEDLLARQRAVTQLEKQEATNKGPEDPAPQPALPGPPDSAATAPAAGLPTSRQNGGRGAPLSPQAWAAKNHPGLMKLPIITRGMHEALRGQYETYVSTELALRQLTQSRELGGGRLAQGERGLDIRERQGERGLDIRESEGRVSSAQADRRLAQGARGLDIREREGRGTSERAERRLAQGKRGLDIRERAATGDELEKLRDEAIAERRKTGKSGPKQQAYAALKGAGRPPSASGSAAVQTELFGELGLPGLAGKIQDDPVRGWLEAYGRLNNRAIFADPTLRQQIMEYLSQNAPTLEQVRDAEKAGAITPEEKALILSVILSPEEQRAPITGPARPPLNRERRFRLPTFMGE